MATPTTKLIIVLGPGGVGKTTSAAALAAALAKRGHRTVVMTVDPALRLAQALGLEELSNDAQRVKTYPQGSLDALWLSQAGALEVLARKHAPSEESLQKMLEHKFFRVIESQLGGVEEYLGIEKALSLVNSDSYDYCILDTPPAQHALDFFDSPQHLLEFFDDSILRHFLEPPREDSGWWKKTLNLGRAKSVELFQNLLGKGFFRDLGTLLGLLKPLHMALRETATQAKALLESPRSTYCLVGILEPHPVEEIQYLRAMLLARGLSRQHIWMANKTLPRSPLPDQSLLIDILGEARANYLAHEKAIQEQLLLKIQKDQKLPSAGAFLPCYPMTQLELKDLEDLGEKALTQWNL